MANVQLHRRRPVYATRRGAHYESLLSAQQTLAFASVWACLVCLTLVGQRIDTREGKSGAVRCGSSPSHSCTLPASQSTLGMCAFGECFRSVQGNKMWISFAVLRSMASDVLPVPVWLNYQVRLTRLLQWWRCSRFHETKTTSSRGWLTTSRKRPSTAHRRHYMDGSSRASLSRFQFRHWGILVSVPA